jgi:putative transposase
VTVCTRDRACLFGHVMNGEMHLNEAGEVTREQWLRTAQMRPNVELDAFMIMPNHLHGIVAIHERCRGTLQRAPTQTERFGQPTSNSIPTIVRLFKSATAKRINQMRGAPGTPVRLRNYYEHVVRNEAELMAIREYIQANPARWDDDENNPAFVEG